MHPFRKHPVLWLGLTILTSCGCFESSPSNPLDGSVGSLFNGIDRPVLIKPEGSERWYTGTDQLIQWTPGIRRADSLVTLQLSSDNGLTYPHVIAANIRNTGIFTWRVPLLPSKLSRIRISGADSTDAGRSPFQILEKPVPIQMTTNGGEWPSWRNDLIAFTSTREGNTDIYAVSSLGSQEIRVTTSPATDRYPVFDSKGAHLAYASSRSGREEIWATSRLLTGNPAEVQLTFLGGTQPTWRPLPSSNRLAYLYRQGSGYYVASLEFTLPLGLSSRIRPQILHGTSTSKDRPSWIIGFPAEGVFYKDLAESPGNTVTYLSFNDESPEPETITLPFRSPVLHPSISPSGTTMAVSVDGDIWLVTIQGRQVVGEPLQVTFSEGYDDFPDLRSDHDLAFQSDRSGRWEIYRISLP